MTPAPTRVTRTKAAPKKAAPKKAAPKKAAPKKAAPKKAAPKKAAPKKAAPSKAASTTAVGADRGNMGGAWRDAALSRMRALIVEADPEIVEERKWRKPSNGMVGVPVWSRHGIVCTGERYTSAVKLTFAWGAKLPDPARLFNASLGGGTRRAIDIHEGDEVDASAFKALIHAAVAENARRAAR